MNNRHVNKPQPTITFLRKIRSKCIMRLQRLITIGNFVRVVTDFYNQPQEIRRNFLLSPPLLIVLAD